MKNIATSMSSEDKKYQTRRDLECLAEAKMIMRDKSRMAAVKELAKAQMDAVAAK